LSGRPGLEKVWKVLVSKNQFGRFAEFPVLQDEITTVFCLNLDGLSLKKNQKWFDKNFREVLRFASKILCNPRYTFPWPLASNLLPSSIYP